MLMNGTDYYTRLLIGMREDVAGKIADEAKTKTQTPAFIHRAHGDKSANPDNNL